MKIKTVYILGAGASKTANLPMQAEILPLVFSLNKSTWNLVASLDDGFMSLDMDERLQRIQESYPRFDEYRQDLGKFIVCNFGSTEKANRYIQTIKRATDVKGSVPGMIKKREEMLFEAYNIAKSVNVTLEDLFTIFDNVAGGREHFRLYTPEAMGEIHRKLKMCIIYALAYAISSNCNREVYDKFSKYLLKERIASPLEDDLISVITMNWDDLLECALYEACEEYNSLLKNENQCIYPDLGFYDYSVNQNDKHIPSVHIKAKGHKNIKVLKMHGSLAWLECPRCGRMYVDFTNEIATEEFLEKTCSYCELGTEIGDDPVLRSLIITPTFMKSLDNLNVKNVWHNAYIDVSEAAHIVFIGYSFPDADFEMRCLLKKAMADNVKVTVVLHPSDNPRYYVQEFVNKGYTDEEANRFVQKMWLPEERYKSFFGEDKVTFFYGGFEEYVNCIGGASE